MVQDVVVKGNVSDFPMFRQLESSFVHLINWALTRSQVQAGLILLLFEISFTFSLGRPASLAVGLHFKHSNWLPIQYWSVYFYHNNNNKDDEILCSRIDILQQGTSGWQNSLWELIPVKIVLQRSTKTNILRQKISNARKDNTYGNIPLQKHKQIKTYLVPKLTPEGHHA